MSKIIIPDLDDSDRAEAIAMLAESLEQEPPLEKPQKEEKLYSREKVRSLLEDMSRKPFMDFLALLLGAHPTEKNVQDFADRNPDKWASAVNLFSKMSGYKEEIEVNHNIYLAVRTMSDMDLEALLRQVNNQIGDSHLVDPLLIEAPDHTLIPNEAASPTSQNIRKHSIKKSPSSYIELPDGRVIRKRTPTRHDPKTSGRPSRKIFEKNANNSR